MSDSEIDEALLAVAKASWRKVALIISQAADKLGSDFTDHEDVCQVIARRVQALVEEGRLMAQGDITEWRYSEVRLA